MLEPMQKWLKTAQNVDKIASDSDLFAKKVCAKEIFGSNLLLGKKTVRASALDSGNSLAIPPKNPWHALCAFRLGSGSEPFSSFAVPKGGLEPPRACAHCVLNTARLPITPLRHAYLLCLKIYLFSNAFFLNKSVHHNNTFF